MSLYAGLDISDKATHVDVVRGDGTQVWRGVCATDPDVISRTLNRHAPDLCRVVLETGPLSVFLYHELKARAVPAICICARHAKKVLSVRVNKSDPHDAEGLAHLARTGWYKQVHIKGNATHIERARLKIRGSLVKSRIAMLGQLRGLMKLFGLRMGTVTTPAKRAERLDKLFAQRPELEAVMQPLIASLEALEGEITQATRALDTAAAADPVCTRLMSVPGVGPITALTFKSAIEDPGRFVKGTDVGAFAGLVPRRSQSGMRDTMGRISKAGDAQLRSALYEAANSLLSRVKRTCALQRWGLKLAQAKGFKRARIAVARKLAILLHKLWQSETEFAWN